MKTTLQTLLIGFCISIIASAQVPPAPPSAPVPTPTTYPTSCAQLQQQVFQIEQFFWLPSELATTLAYNPDTYTKLAYGTNYDWTQAAQTVSACENVIESIQQDSTLTTAQIGASTGVLIASKVSIQRAALAEVATLNRALLATLTPSQMVTLGTLQRNMATAQSMVNLGYDAYTANFLLSQVNLPGSNQNYKTANQNGLQELEQVFAKAVTQAHADRINKKAAADRQAHMLPVLQ